MKYYQELTILPDQDMSIAFIWSKVYQQLHIAFAERKKIDNLCYGVSFPEYKNEENLKLLGRKLRIFAESEETLEKLAVKSIMIRYEDYVHVTSIRKVPETLKGYASYGRFQMENSPANKARRYAKRHDIPVSEAVKLFPDNRKIKQPPYIQMKSLSSGERFRLYIVKQVGKEKCAGAFGTYGLDARSTVPEF